MCDLIRNLEDFFYSAVKERPLGILEKIRIHDRGKYFLFCALKPRGTSFKNWQFVGTKPENVEEWFPNQGKGVFDRYFHTYLCRRSQKFEYIPEISDRGNFHKNLPKIPCLGPFLVKKYGRTLRSRGNQIDFEVKYLPLLTI